MNGGFWLEIHISPWWLCSDCNWTRTYNHLVHKRTLHDLPKLAKWLSWVVSTYLYVTFDRMFLSCQYAFQSKFTLYSCLNVKELLAQNKCNTWSLSDSNRIGTQNHLVHKQILNHLAKLAKWLSCVVVSSYLHGAFDCMLLSCHVRLSEWINIWRNIWS